MGWKVCDKWKENPVNKQRDAYKEGPSPFGTSYRSSPLLLFWHHSKFFLSTHYLLEWTLISQTSYFSCCIFYLLFSVSSPPIFQVLPDSTFSPKPSLLSSFLETLLHFLVMECMFLSLFLILSSHVLGYDLFLISFFL